MRAGVDREEAVLPTGWHALHASETARWTSEVDGLVEMLTNAGAPGEEWPYCRASHDVDGFTMLAAKFPGVDPNTAALPPTGLLRPPASRAW